MADLPLPADVAAWPENPFELLGTTTDADAKTLKRAYQRLIKVYRPEQYPDEFRRVREAYEAAESIQALMAVAPPSQAAAIAAEHAVSTPAAAPQADVAAPPQDAVASQSATTDDAYATKLVDCWQAAKGGDFLTAYDRARALRADSPERHEAYVALYWLLRISPKLDGDRTACDWLLKCIEHATAMRGAALELYRREVERKPEEALTTRCRRLMCELLREGPAFLVADWRWQAAAFASQWRVIRDDVDALRKTPHWLNRDAWLRILWSAVECSCWSDDAAAVDLTKALAAEMENLAEAEADALTQLDFLLEVAKHLRKFRDDRTVAALRPLIERSWSATPADLYLLLCFRLGLAERNSAEVLRMMIALAGTSTTLLERYGHALSLIENEVRRDEKELWTLEKALPVVVEFIDASDWRASNYDDDFRRRLLRFCLDERIPPTGVAACLADDPYYQFPDGPPLAEILQHDLPLQYAYQTIRLLTD